MDDALRTTSASNRKQNERTKSDMESNYDSENDFPQYIIIESIDEQRPLARLSPFWIHKALSTGTLTSVKIIRSGNILIYTTTKIYSQKLLKLEELAGVPVKATPHWSLNTSKVVVRCAELKKCSQDEILENLETQGVIDHYNISVRSDDGQRKKQIHTLSHSTVPHHQKK